LTFIFSSFNGTSYCISIFVADTSQLKNRSIMFAFQASPYIATTWIGGPLATLFLNGPGFRWGYGAFAIIVPVVSFPLWALFAYNYNKAKKAGLVPVRQSNRTLFESVKHYVIEFDVLGILLFATGLALFLLSFNLYTYQADQWKSPMIICFIVFGGLLVIAFALYEKYLAPKCFIPFELLTDRTVLSACWLGGFFFISFYVWDAYFLSFLQVVNGLTITEASYVGNIYTIGSCFWSFVVAILIRITGRFKWLAVYFGVPVTMLGVGLMIAFRQPDVNIGYIIMCQIFIAFAGGTIVITEQMAVMAATSHQYIAVVLALLGMFSYIGGAIGNTVAAAVWTGVFPVRLAEYLPAEEQANLMSIYGDITVQMSYPKGTAARAAIERAYGDAQRDMLIGGTAILAAAMVCVLLWRDIKVKDFRQVKGNVI
jgi:MFS family permease